MSSSYYMEAASNQPPSVASTGMNHAASGSIPAWGDYHMHMQHHSQNHQHTHPHYYNPYFMMAQHHQPQQPHR